MNGARLFGWCILLRRRRTTGWIGKGWAKKLRVSGLHPKVTDFLMSWSEDRLSKVVIGGAHSPNDILANSVFQEIVFGPPLRNLFYADARFAVNARGFTKTVFADFVFFYKVTPHTLETRGD